MDLGMKKFTVRRFFSVYLRRKSRSKSSSLSRLEVGASAQVSGHRRALGDAAASGPAPRSLACWVPIAGLACRKSDVVVGLR